MDLRDDAIRDTVTVKPEQPPAPALTLDTSASPQNSQNGGGSVTSPLAEREQHRASKIAACLSCRRSKVRCEKGTDPVRCRRCAQTGGDCVRPTFNVGRRKGVKNKRKGLEKALYQVEEALKRAGPDVQATDAGKAILELKTMLANGQEAQLNGSVDGGGGGSHKRPRLTNAGSSADQDDTSSSDDEQSPRSRKRRESILTQPSSHHHHHHHRQQQRSAAVKPEERLAVDDAENPLQLLARASNLHLSPESSHGQSPGASISLPSVGVNGGGGAGATALAAAAVEELDPEMRQVETFFGTTHFNVDQGEDYDPVDLGLVTEEEAEMLFDFFHKNLSHTRWGLDPVLYTVPWTRTRSPFLFTSIMAAAALFIESAAALSKRLSKHCKQLASKVIQKRHRSTEVVLAFMINVPWMGPGAHSTDDETCWFVSLATTIAIDLQMHKMSMPAEAFKNGTAGDLDRQDCIDPELALRSGGFRDVDPQSEMGRRLVRRRERCWISLFVLERGMCLARGRSYTLPMTPLIRRVDQWHISDIADGMDGALVSMAVLRRDLDGLFETIRSMCNGSREGMTDGSLIARSIQTAVDKFFEQWYLEWGQTIGQGPQNRLPPYVEILVTHTRLSIYSSVINTPTAPLEVRHFFRTAGLSASLNVMRASVQGEKQLFSMPNNTAIMVSFAACFALRLSTQISSFHPGVALAPSVRTLIEELSDVLEKIGNITRHRNGMCGLYAKYLRILVRKAAAEGMSGSGGGGAVDAGRGGAAGTGGRKRKSTTTATAATTTTARTARTATPGMGGALGGGFAVPAPPPLGGFDAGGGGWSSGASAGAVEGSDLFPFSSMSGDQIVEALSRAGGEFDVGSGGGDGDEFGTGGLEGNGSAGGAGGGGGGGGTGFVWDDMPGMDFLPTWSNWPDFGF